MHAELHPQLVLEAYAQGVFPMGGAGGQINWYTADPRTIFEPSTFHVPRSLRQIYRQGRFELTIDREFGSVIRACADREEGTWINRDIERVFIELHEVGFAHSVEAWQGGELVGGLYGLVLGGAFMGESMFYCVANASKVALVHLVRHMKQRGMVLLDTQFPTPHLKQFNCISVPRAEYMRRLKAAMSLPVSFGE